METGNGVIPAVSSWWDSRKSAAKRHIADLLSNPSDVISQLSGLAQDNLNSQKANAQDAQSVMPEVRQQANDDLQQDPVIQGFAQPGALGTLVPLSRAMARSGDAAATKLKNATAFLTNANAGRVNPMSSQEMWQASNAMLAGTPYNGIVDIGGRKYVELSDAGSKLKPENFNTLSNPDLQHPELGSVYEHPALYQLYPELAQTQTRLRVDPSSQPAGVTLSHDPSTDEPFFGASGRHEYELHDITAHEVQHGVQGIDDMGIGSNPQLELDQLLHQNKVDTSTLSASDKKDWTNKAFQNYQDTLGEVIARITEKRRQLTNASSAGIPYENALADQLGNRPARLKFGPVNPWGTESFSY